MSFRHFYSSKPTILNLYIQIVTFLFNWRIWNYLIILLRSHYNHICWLYIYKIYRLVILKYFICKSKFKTWWIKAKYKTIRKTKKKVFVVIWPEMNRSYSCTTLDPDWFMICDFSSEIIFLLCYFNQRYIYLVIGATHSNNFRHIKYQLWINFSARPFKPRHNHSFYCMLKSALHLENSRFFVEHLYCLFISNYHMVSIAINISNILVIFFV